ncbi:MAG: membrane protein insertase YidC [Solirubrobacterales bacterium]
MGTSWAITAGDRSPDGAHSPGVAALHSPEHGLCPEDRALGQGSGDSAKYSTKLRDKKGAVNFENQRKMSEEINALYKTAGVNPLGGCLPMVIQLPVLIAFYNLLANAIELRGAPWLGWIQDLSVHDPLFVLPIVMGAAQFAQQALAPAVGDPTQRKIFMILPVMFTVMFAKAPSGLVLYWLVNNLLSLVQHRAFYQRWNARRAEASAS